MSEADDLLAMFEDLDKHSEKEVRENIIKPPFGWPGGKSKSVAKIVELLPYTDTYVEVFGGSGATLLTRSESKLEVFNDRFSGITDFYKVIRDHDLMYKLVERLEMTVHSREEWIDCKTTWENTHDPVERAAKWYYMVVYSFGAQSRNFGRGCYDGNNISGKLINRLPEFPTIHKRLRKVLIENQSWQQLVADFDKSNVVFYMDPPYLDAYRGIYKHEMTEEEHKDLLETIFRMKGYVALSSYKNNLYDAYPWDSVHSWEQYVSMTAMSFRDENKKSHLQDQTTRTNATEVLYVKEAN